MLPRLPALRLRGLCCCGGGGALGRCRLAAPAPAPAPALHPQQRLLPADRRLHRGARNSRAKIPFITPSSFRRRYLIPGGSAGRYEREGYIFDVGSSMMFGLGERGTTNLITRALAAVGRRLDTVPDPTQIHYRLPKSAAHPEARLGSCDMLLPARLPAA